MLRQVLNRSKDLRGLTRLKCLGSKVLLPAKSSCIVWNFKKNDLICFHLFNQPVRRFSSSIREKSVKLSSEEICRLVAAANSPEELSKKFFNLAFHLNDKAADLSELILNPNQAKKLIISLGNIKYAWLNLSPGFRYILIENLSFKKSDDMFEACSVMQSLANMGYDAADGPNELVNFVLQLIDSVLTAFLSGNDNSKKMTSQDVLTFLKVLQRMNFNYPRAQKNSDTAGAVF